MRHQVEMTLWVMVERDVILVVSKFTWSLLFRPQPWTECARVSTFMCRYREFKYE